ncbi:hypothetical protein ABZU76_08335 [Amycolatopsis sp. NPDC005232]|uniref:hypothetical protein n=1 Tax=Amycolatopsis sp. NPDC005232 TaxID=3157027 RepID=UPI0033B8FAB1
MEATDLVFLANGQGWSVWSNALSSEQAVPMVDPGAATGHLRPAIRPNRPRREVPGRGGRAALARGIDTGYRIGPGRNAAGGAETVLAVDGRISFSDRFALERHELWTEDDPAGWTLL